MKQEVTSRIVVITTIVIREIILQRRPRQFFLEQIDLVQEENDGGLDEPARVTDGIEKSESLCKRGLERRLRKVNTLLALHSVDGFILVEHLVILGQGDEENEGRDVFEAVDPFLTFTSLASDVEEAVCEFTNSEHCFRNTGSLDTRAQDVLIRRHVTGMCHAVD